VLSVADGRVHQRGWRSPWGNLARIELEGSVDFDRNLDMTASLPIPVAMLGDRPLLASIAAGGRVTVPIRGTLSRPPDRKGRAFGDQMEGALGAVRS
jgi:translocation and assembly module TamB